MKKSTDDIKRFIENIVSPMGYEVLEVAFSLQYGSLNLTIFIGNEGSITLDDCERVHNAIDAPLDEFDPTEGAAYVLNVSSYGLDRPIETERDFRRAVGERLDITLVNAVGGKKKYTAVLKAYDQDKIVVTLNGADVPFSRSDIAKIKRHISFE
ncbi:MAG: ribosome maturation factor RimP [Clostridiales bacterium]|nr:ribosome maturation factor RimP [Clostridiales bacterium]